ncbi:hypothetical protein HZS_5433 [Henneguya salminicola]|nr:hypothetical protein HZS_5433 [Henneguya salminicola]
MLFFNLIYKSLIDDNDSERKRAIVKRLLQVCIHQTPEFECSCLLLLSELYPEKSDLIQLFSFEKPDEEELQKSNALTKNSTSWDFKNLHSKIDLFTTYNWKHPDPKTCNSSSTDIWEIVLFDRHYHASVRPFIKNFLNGELKYGGDPLVDFTHTSFIDRFIRREAKIKTTTSIHQRKITTDKSIKPINEIMQNDTSTLLPEENLIQQYYKNNKKAVKKRRKRSEEISTDDESDFSHLSTFGKNSKVKCEKKPRTGSNT